MARPDSRCPTAAAQHTSAVQPRASQRTRRSWSCSLRASSVPTRTAAPIRSSSQTGAAAHRSRPPLVAEALTWTVSCSSRTRCHTSSSLSASGSDDRPGTTFRTVGVFPGAACRTANTWAPWASSSSRSGSRCRTPASNQTARDSPAARLPTSWSRPERRDAESIRIATTARTTRQAAVVEANRRVIRRRVRRSRATAGDMSVRFTPRRPGGSRPRARSRSGRAGRAVCATARSARPPRSTSARSPRPSSSRSARCGSPPRPCAA